MYHERCCYFGPSSMFTTYKWNPYRCSALRSTCLFIFASVISQYRQTQRNAAAHASVWSILILRRSFIHLNLRPWPLFKRPVWEEPQAHGNSHDAPAAGGRRQMARQTESAEGGERGQTRPGVSTARQAAGCQSKRWTQRDSQVGVKGKQNHMLGVCDITIVFFNDVEADFCLESEDFTAWYRFSKHIVPNKIVVWQTNNNLTALFMHL